MTSVHKKISIILPNFRGGGAERLHIYLANDWVEHGFVVEFIVLRNEGELIPLLAPEIQIKDLAVDRMRDAIIPLAHHFRSSDIDIILAAMWPLTSVSIFSWLFSNRQARIFVIDHVYLTMSCKNELKININILKAVMRATYHFSHGIIAVAEGVKKDIMSLGRLKASNVKVIYNPATKGVSPHRESLSMRNQLWGEGFTYHILSVGSLKPQKDHITLIKAFAIVAKKINAKLTILGDGDLKDEIVNFININGLANRVSMPGFVLNTESYFRTADLFVNSSRWDGLPLVLIEALEFGVPVVSTDCPSGPAEILENGKYGILVPVNNPEALAVAIKNSLEAQNNINALINRAQDFTIRKISDQYISYMLS